MVMMLMIHNLLNQSSANHHVKVCDESVCVCVCETSQKK